jgi:hypothetical protein
MSEVTLLAGLLAVPVCLGLICICIADAYLTRRPMAPAVHPHQM